VGAYAPTHTYFADISYSGLSRYDWHLYLEFMMAKNKKPNLSKRQQRSLRTQQIVFYAIGIIIILSMVISLVAN